MEKLKLTLIWLLFGARLGAQVTPEPAQKSLLVSGYLEPYFTYDFSEPEDHLRPGFLYNFNRHNEVHLNLGLIKASYTEGRLRANLGLMAGTYAQYNLAAEPDLLRHVFESNAGYKLAASGELWLDIGIFPSHIGFESAIGKDNWTLTRSLLAENSPYYESGARLTYSSPSGQWTFAALYLNGWQRMVRPEGNNTPAVGTQVTYKPSSGLILNWSTFSGNDKKDEEAQWRFFNNFYGIVQLSENVGLIAGLDIGTEASANPDAGSNLWFSPILIGQVSLAERWNLNGRLEYYSDEHGVIVSTQTPNGFQTLGIPSTWITRFPVKHYGVWRPGGLSSKDRLFVLNKEPSKVHYALTTSFCVAF
ncbi:MAG: porin [Haliscomenobacter sp.]|nr:porin [Haliscomenobacter sp.]